jgi:hypothetical protein
MPGLVPEIHVFVLMAHEGQDGRDTPTMTKSIWAAPRPAITA